ncbi:hypothetical protein MAR_027931 [Mya arenaria]|uniref:Uncharacterized protein n=1 Tax=Mya arenaria TaxID=6604 RepID=A0ABY7DF39_MYAAR|nr:hypothetical protein MAR_027931 [Mya arenaria]
MKNEDDMCFTWCVLRALNPVDKISERIDKSLKDRKDLLNMNGIEYPVTLKAIDRCLNSFNSEESLGKHNEYCDSNDAVKIEMLEEGSTLNFKHFFKSMRVFFIVYADFESFTQKLDTAQPYPYDSYTK